MTPLLEPCTIHTTLIITWLAPWGQDAKGITCWTWNTVGACTEMELVFIGIPMSCLMLQMVFSQAYRKLWGYDLHDVSSSLVVTWNEQTFPLQIDSFKWCSSISEIGNPHVHVKVVHCFTVGGVLLLFLEKERANGRRVHLSLLPIGNRFKSLNSLFVIPKHLFQNPVKNMCGECGASRNLYIPTIPCTSTLEHVFGILL